MAEPESNSLNVVLRACAELSPEALTALFIASWPGGGTPCFELD